MIAHIAVASDFLGSVVAANWLTSRYGLVMVTHMSATVATSASVIDPLNEAFPHADALVEWLDEIETRIEDGDE